MAALSQDLGKEVAVLANRRGQITAVAIAEGDRFDWPPLKKREAISRLSGIRCIHIHPSGGGLSRADLVALALHRFDLMVAIDATELRNAQAWLGHLAPEPDAEGNLWRLMEPDSVYHIEHFNFEEWIQEQEHLFAELTAGFAVSTQEKAILLALSTGESVEGSLEELVQLVKTAGAEVLDSMVQRRDRPESATYIGKGKVQELALMVQELGATMVVVDAELSPSQQKNLEDALNVKVLDRPGIILDIFAQRAQTREGKLQVELAQLNYMLPRLAGRGETLSRLGGGIGTRGPGETKLEVDRRRIWKRISHLEEEIDTIKRQRQAQRKSREKQGVVVVALVGYTNSGKSTLLNALTNADVLTENKLFATLDPTTRRLYLPEGETVLLSDTVGFIQHLPHQLVAAFRATLEEVTEADILLHVVDASHPDVWDQIQAVRTVLGELHAEDKPTIAVLNKIDRLTNKGSLRKLLEELPNAVAISAKRKEGFPELIDKIQDLVAQVLRYRGGSSWS